SDVCSSDLASSRTSKYRLGCGIDQVHVVEVGVKPNWLSGGLRGGRLYARAYLFSVHRKEHHRLHAHGLDHIHGHAELATRVAFFSARLRDVLGPQAEAQILADGR